MNKQEIETLALTESGLKKDFDREEETYYQREKVRIYDLVVKLCTQFESEFEKCWDEGRRYEAGEMELPLNGKTSAYDLWRNTLKK